MSPGDPALLGDLWWCAGLTDLALFVATANTSIVTLNLSLMLNKVGFYQVRTHYTCRNMELCSWLRLRHDGNTAQSCSAGHRSQLQRMHMQYIAQAFFCI